MNDFLSGVVVALVLTASLFFARFWTQTRDRLFLYFSGAFVLLALNFALLAGTARDHEARPFLYLIRLVAFLLIIVAIVDKNRQR